MPTNAPTVEEVRELLARAELCLNDGVSWAGPSIEIVAALCRHFLANPLTAGEFAGLVLIEHLKSCRDYETLATTGTCDGLADAMNRADYSTISQVWKAAAKSIERIASEHNITIVEPNNDRS